MANKPGNPNWEKGVSANPGGRRKAPVRFRELYDEDDCDEKNYRRLCYWRDQNDYPAASTKAIEMLMDRRYGKTPTTDDDGNAVKDTQITIVRQSARDIAHTPEPTE